MKYKIHIYKILDKPNKGILIGEYDTGFYWIPKLSAHPRDNIFANIEEIRIITGLSIADSPYITKEYEE